MNWRSLWTVTAILTTLLLAACGGGSGAERYFDTGVDFHEQGRLEEAIAQYDEAIIRDPQHVGAYVNRSAAYLDLGEFQEVIRDSTAAIRLDSQLDVA